MLDTILSLLLDEKTIGTVVVGLLGFVTKWVVSAVRRRNVALAVHHAFYAVEDWAAVENDGGALDKALDKVTVGLKKADEWMKVNGWRELKPHEKEVAALTFKAMHGVQTVALRLADAGAATVLPPGEAPAVVLKSGSPV